MSSIDPSAAKQNDTLSLDFKDLPALYHVTNKAAKTHQRGFTITILIEMGFTVLGAIALVLEENPAFVRAVGPVASLQVNGSTLLPLSLATAAGLLGTAVTLGFQYVLKPADKWRQCRFLAERCATLAWRYAGHAAPIDLGRAGTSQQDVNSWYLEQYGALLKQAEPLDLPEVAKGQDEVLTPTMKAVRASPLAERFTVYLHERATDQRNWYNRRSLRFRRRRNALRIVTVVIYIVGAALIILHATALHTLAPFDLLVPNYWPLVVALAGAVTTFAAALHYDDLQRTYWYMAALLTGELNVMEGFSPTGGDEAKVSEWVDKIETLMDVEHRQWHALIKNERAGAARQN